MIKSSSSSRMRNKTNLIVGPIHVYPEEALNVQYIRRYSLICLDYFFIFIRSTDGVNDAEVQAN